MLSRLDHELILLLYEKGTKQTVIARQLKVSRSRINQIIIGYMPLPHKLRKEVEKKLSNKCYFCEKPRQHIHHVDRDSHNNSLENLMPLCITHHGQIHKNTRRKKYLNQLKNQTKILRRQIKQCLYCSKDFFPEIGREKLQKYHHDNCRKYDYLKRRLARVSSSVTLTSPETSPITESI